MPLPRGYKRKKLRNWRTFCAKGSIRTVKSGKARVLVCCPRGRWKPRAQRCKVGTRAIAIDRPKGFGAMKRKPPTVRPEDPRATHAYRGHLLIWNPRRDGYTIDRDGKPIVNGFYPLAEAKRIIDELS